MRIMRERFRSLQAAAPWRKTLRDECKGRIRALARWAGGDEKSAGESLRKFFNAIKAALGVACTCT